MEKFTTRLQQIVSEFPEKIASFSADEMSHRPAPGKWSKREIIGHLCDSALHNWQRFTSAQTVDGPLEITPYAQAELVRQNNYQNLPTAQLIALWSSLNTQIIATVKNIPAEKLSHPVQLPDGATTYSDEHAGTLRWLIEDYLVHLEHHLHQIFPGKKIAVPTLPHNWKISTDEALKALAENPNGKPFLTLLEHKKVYVEVYVPEKVDLQTPHDQDEIYVVISGEGTFFNHGERVEFGPGDLLFVPAGVEHRFENFSEDFYTWVIFCG